jgi:glutamyl-tRNA reductase
LEYLIVSFTHKNTNIQTREKLNFGNNLEKEIFLQDILQSDAINEAILISTCNRVEFILSVSCTHGSQKVILRSLVSRSNISQEELENLADVYSNEDAIYHLFTVVSSLDSLVIGETQIAGQVKDAFRFSSSKNFCNGNLSKVLNYSFKCAAKVRVATSLGTGSVSVASTAVAKAKDIYKNINGISAVVIGAGEMSEIAIKHLLKANFQVIICSRNIQKAKVLAQSLNSDVIVEPYSKLQELLNTKKLLVTATSAPYPIITKSLVQEVEFTRNWFDIAVPRDIEEINIPNTNIYSVDDLQGIVDENIVLREGAAKIAYAIIRDTTNEFFLWEKSLNVEPIIKQIYLNAKTTINKKVNNAIKKGHIDKDNIENITKLCHTVINEFLHQSSKTLREVSVSNECDDILNITKDIFNISNK